jgi:hypothetical protein
LSYKIMTIDFNTVVRKLLCTRAKSREIERERETERKEYLPATEYLYFLLVCIYRIIACR